MNKKDMQAKTTAELTKELFELRREQFNLSMQKGMDDGLKPHLYRRVRRNIARVKTILNQKEREV